MMDDVNAADFLGFVHGEVLFFCIRKFKMEDNCYFCSFSSEEGLPSRGTLPAC